MDHTMHRGARGAEVHRGGGDIGPQHRMLLRVVAVLAARPRLTTAKPVFGMPSASPLNT